MKSKIMCVLFVFLLSISITSCSSNKSSSNLNNSSNVSSNKISDTMVSTISSDPINTPLDSKTENIKTQLSSENNKNSAMEAYKAVVENKAKFFSTDNKKNLYLNDFLTNKEVYGAIFKVTHFTVLDMDGDKIPEVVLELTVGDYPEFYEVLHYMNGEVYGYIQVYRGLEMLKIDGTFWGSGGASDNECGKLRFNSSSCEIDILGYMKSSTNNDGTTISYFINNKPVTKELFDSFSKEQNGKKDVEWYGFSEKNIETELSINSYETLTDLKNEGIQIDNNQSFWINLDSHGKVKFISASKEIKNYFYLADAQNNIIYTFPDLYSNGNTFDSNAEDAISTFKVSAVSFQDINNDGLKDVAILLTNIVSDTDTRCMIYTQQKDGTFIFDTKLYKDMNYKGFKDIKSVINYIKH